MKTKHTLVMAAVAIAAGAAVAEPTLSLYGNLDVGLTNTKNSNTAWGLQPPFAVAATPSGSSSTTGISSGVMSDSFIGFKGTEDLGGGMEAQFVLESYLNIDTGATSSSPQALSAIAQLSAGPGATWNTRDEGGFFARNAYVGLKTNYGLIRLGQMDNLGYLSAVKYNPFGTASINPTTRVFYGTDYYARGWSNTLAYYLRADGFLFGIQHAPKNDNSVTAAAGNQGGNKTTAVISYAAGPASVSVGYETNKDNISSPGVAKSYALHGSYDFGVVKLFAEYGSGKQDSDASLDVKSKGYQLGVSVPMGNGAFLASYAAGELESDNSFANLAVTAGTKFRDVKVYAVGYTYALSKRSGLYAAYTVEKDSYPIPGVFNSVNNLKLDSKLFAVGVNHQF